MAPRPNPLGGTARDVQAQRTRTGPSARAAALTAKQPSSAGEGTRLFGHQSEAVSAVTVVEGSSASAAQTTVELTCGSFALGPDRPFIPVGRQFDLRWVAASFMGTAVPPDSPWTLSILVRRAGETAVAEVATFTVQTEQP